LIESPESEQDLYVQSQRGYCFLQLGQYEAAIADFSHVLEDRHDDAFALRYRGLAYAGLGETGQSLGDIRRAAASDPNKRPLWKAWGEVIRQHYRPRQYAGVQREWQQTVDIAPTLPQAWFYTSTWLLLVDRSDEYHLMVQRLIEQSADLNGNELARAVVLCALDPVAIQEQDQRQLRLDLAAKAVAEGPTWCRTHAAIVQVRCGKPVDGLAALQSLEDDADSGESSALLAAYLALAFQSNGNDDAAEKALEIVEATDLEAIDTLSIQIQLEVLLDELRAKRPLTVQAVGALQRVD
jgi:tetratricopeptide (TPR) repeat protein